MKEHIVELGDWKYAVGVKRSYEAGRFPIFHIKKPGDVGFDLPVILPKRGGLLGKLWGGRWVIIWPFTTRKLASGIHIEMPDTLWASLRDRSSTSKSKMMVLGGIIDAGYRGELFSLMMNFSFLPKLIKHGDRLVQLIYFPRIIPNHDIREELSPSERGEDGFGSTGK